MTITVEVLLTFEVEDVASLLDFTLRDARRHGDADAMPEHYQDENGDTDPAECLRYLVDRGHAYDEGTSLVESTACTVPESYGPMPTYDLPERCEHGYFWSGAGACPKCGS